MDETLIWGVSWDERILAFIAELRERRPLPPQDTRLNVVQEQQCAQILAWLRAEMDLSEECCIVFHSNRPGLVAMQRYAGELGLNAVPAHLLLLFDREVARFQAFLDEIENAGWVLRSWYGVSFEKVARSRKRLGQPDEAQEALEELRLRVLAEGGVLYEFSWGQSHSPLCGQGGASLWRADGDQLSLIRHHFTWIS